MYSFLPDELLKEILAPALQVPDESFACSNGRSPFSNYTPTTSGYLLVCKDWLRVATPLLYSVVVLRSKAQIQALESSIENTPILGTFIRKLRIESGYCASLSLIIKNSTNLTDLCLSLEVYSSDNVAGICNAFGCIKPVKLIIYDMPGKYSRRRLTNQKRDQFVETLKEYIAKWERLTMVTLPWCAGWDSNFPNFVEAICRSETIEVVSLGAESYYYDWMGRLCQSKSLKRIVIRGNRKIMHSSVVYAIQTNPKLGKLLHWLEEDDKNEDDKTEDDITSSSCSSSSASSSVKSVKRNWILEFPDNVWFNILFFAMAINEIEQLDPFCFPRHIQPEYMSTHRRKLVLVCKKLHKLALPLYYRTIVISRNRDVQSVNAVFSRKRQLGKQVKAMLVYDLSHSAEVGQSLTKFFSYTPNLRRIIANRLGYIGYPTSTTDVLDWASLCVLAQKAGSKLMDLAIHLHRPSQAKSPDLFYQFTALRWLDFSSPARFEFDPAEVEKDALPNLETITCNSINNTFLSFLSCLNLPEIRCAHFQILDRCDGAITFLRKHGSKLRTLELPFLPGVSVFDICSNLEQFIVPNEKPGYGVAEFFYSNNEHHPLRTVHIKTCDILLGAEKEKFKYLGGLDLSNFNLLREIRVDRCAWPVTEHEIKKSHWVAWAERLQELYKIDIVNSEGQRWIPRLQVRRDR